MAYFDAPSFASYAASNDVDESSNFAQDALSVAVGSVVDFGTSLYNSVNWAWGGEDASTYDVLSSMGMDTMASGYLEHKGLINTLSFVGGMFIPGMAGVKLSKVARAGLKSTNFLSPAHQTQSFAKLAKLTAEGKKATSEFRKLQHTTMYKGIAQGMVDNAAAEVAIAMSMNAHPFMEDYMDNFGENFATSLLIGSGIGAIVDTASTWYQVKRAVGGVEAASQQTVLNALPSQSLSTDGFTNFKEMQHGIKAMDQLINNAEVNELTRGFAIRTRETLVSNADAALQSGLKGQLAQDMTSSNEMAEHLRNLFDKEITTGVGEAAYFIPKHQQKTAKGRVLQRVTQPIKEVYDKATGKLQKLEINAVYSPREDIIVTPEEANRLAGVADVSTTSEIKAMARRTNIHQIDDIALDMQVELPAHIETRYLASLVGYDTKPLGLRIAVHESDLPSLQGMRFRAAKETAVLRTARTQLAELQEQVATATGDELKKLNQQIKQQEKLVAKTEAGLKTEVGIISNADNLFNTQVLTKQVQQSTGIKPTHLQDLDKISSSARRMSDWEGISNDAHNAIRRWISGGGGERDIRKAIAEYRRNPQTAPSWIREIMEHPERKRQQAELMKQADSEGYIYLRRGQNTRPNGHNEAESYTTSPKRSKQFAQGTEHDYAYKIKVEDVVGYIHGYNEAEWVVMAPTREYAKDVTKFSRIITNEVDNTLATSVPKLTLEEVGKYVDDATRQHVKQYAASGMAPEEIARRTNLETESVETLLASHGSDQVTLNYRYNDAAKLNEYMSPTQRMISLADNGRLLQYRDYVNMMQQNADQAALDKWNLESTISLMQTSNSATVQTLMQDMGLGLTNTRGRNEFINLHDMLKQSLGMVTDGLAGNRVLQSADMYSRMMGDAGNIVNYIGELHSRVANRMNDILIGPANQYLSAIAQDEAQLLTHNILVNAYRSSGKKLRFNADYVMEEFHGVVRTMEGVVEDWRPLNYLGKEMRIPEHMQDLRRLFDQYANIGQEIQQMRTTAAKVTGAALPTDKGLWLPSFDPRSKFVGFIRTTEYTEDGIPTFANRIVTGNTLEELNDKRNILMQRAEKDGTNVDFIWPKSRNLQNSVEYDKLKHEALKGKLQLADLGQAKKGFAAEELPNATLEEARNLLHGYSSSIYAHTQDMQGMLMSDIVNKLDNIRDFSRMASDDQGMSAITKFLKTQVDAASVMKSTLLGSRGLLDNYVPAKALNDGFSNMVDLAITKVNNVRDSIATKVTPSTSVTEKWAKIQDELEAAGIPYPFRDLEPAAIESQFAREAAKGDARRLVSVGNAFASTMALRFLELAHPLVNMLSMPILMQSAMGSSPTRLMGATASAAKGTGMFQLTKYMYDGVRLVNNPTPAMTGLLRRAQDNGLFKPIVSEATDVIKLTRLRERGAIAQAERLLDKIDSSLMVNGKSLLTGASDWSETMARRTAFGVGTRLAMERYGLKLGVDDDKIYLFARDFIDRSIGNYAAHQRPVMFHGTLGAAAGLFQTYMVTFAQNIYRNLEARDFSTIAKTMAWQGSIFGMSSLPGYDLMSKYIGEHYTKDHTDLTTGAYKNLDDGMANVLVYGLPSNIGALWGDSQIGPNLTTRGAIELPPRVGIPAAQMIYDSGAAVAEVASRLSLAGDVDAGRGFLEALSVQSISRPIARMSEVALGYSVTSQGRTVSTPEEVWTPAGIASRILATRPTEEWRTRSALHLNTYYGSLDRDNRQKAMENIRTMIRDRSLTESALTSAFSNYLENGGTAQGFRSALNNALQFENQSMDVRLLDDIRPDSPILHMIDTM